MFTQDDLARLFFDRDLPEQAKQEGFATIVKRPNKLTHPDFGPDISPEMCQWLDSQWPAYRHGNTYGSTWIVYPGPTCAKEENEKLRKQWRSKTNRHPLALDYHTNPFKFDLFAFKDKNVAFAFKMRWC